MFNLLTKEKEHLNLLPLRLKQLLISFILYATAYPVILIFISAYIWKNNGDLSSLVFFRTDQFLAVPFVFLLNGLIINFIWLTVQPLVMKNIDLDSHARQESRFNYVLDSEFF